MTRKTIDDVVKLMRQLVRLGVSEPALLDVVHAIAAGDDRGVLENLTQELRSRLGPGYGVVRYSEVPPTPAQTLLRRRGDADDIANLVAALLEVLGFSWKFRVTRSPGRKFLHHVYVLAGVPRAQPTEWIAIDPMADRELGWEPEADERVDFEGGGIP